ncbi:MAG: type VI secretion system amidase effector protein Tae4 [Bacteroidota bacterium]
MQLPSYFSLEQNYDTDSDTNAVKARMGGGLTASWLGNNTCAMRVSKALNYAGVAHRIKRGHGMEVVKGEDGLLYGYRVAELKKYMKSIYGSPKLIEKGTKIKQADFYNRKGIIAFDVKGWSDATGHFSLWDGAKVLYGDEFSLPTTGTGVTLVQVSLWVCP